MPARAFAEYLARLRCFSTVETTYVKASNPLREGSQLLSRSEGCFRLVLDEKGRKLSSRAFAEEVKKIEGNPRKGLRDLDRGRGWAFAARARFRRPPLVPQPSDSPTRNGSGHRAGTDLSGTYHPRGYSLP